MGSQGRAGLWCSGGEAPRDSGCGGGAAWCRPGVCHLCRVLRAVLEQQDLLSLYFLLHLILGGQLSPFVRSPEEPITWVSHRTATRKSSLQLGSRVAWKTRRSAGELFL